MKKFLICTSINFWLFVGCDTNKKFLMNYNPNQNQFNNNYLPANPPNNTTNPYFYNDTEMYNNGYNDLTLQSSYIPNNNLANINTIQPMNQSTTQDFIPTSLLPLNTNQLNYSLPMNNSLNNIYPLPKYSLQESNQQNLIPQTYTNNINTTQTTYPQTTNDISDDKLISAYLSNKYTNEQIAKYLTSQNKLTKDMSDLQSFTNLSNPSISSKTSISDVYAPSNCSSKNEELQNNNKDVNQFLDLKKEIQEIRNEIKVRDKTYKINHSKNLPGNYQEKFRKKNIEATVLQRELNKKDLENSILNEEIGLLKNKILELSNDSITSTKDINNVNTIISIKDTNPNKILPKQNNLKSIRNQIYDLLKTSNTNNTQNKLKTTKDSTNVLISSSATTKKNENENESLPIYSKDKNIISSIENFKRSKTSSDHKPNNDNNNSNKEVKNSENSSIDNNIIKDTSMGSEINRLNDFKLENCVKKTTNDTTLLEEKLELLNNEKVELANRLKLIELENKKLKEENNSCNTRILELTNLNLQLINDKGNESKEEIKNSDLQNIINKRNNRIKNLESQVSNLKKTNSCNKEKILNLENKIKISKKVIDKYKNDLKDHKLNNPKHSNNKNPNSNKCNLINESNIEFANFQIYIKRIDELFSKCLDNEKQYIEINKINFDIVQLLYEEPKYLKNFLKDQCKIPEILTLNKWFMNLSTIINTLRRYYLHTRHRTKIIERVKILNNNSSSKKSNIPNQVSKSGITIDNKFRLFLDNKFNIFGTKVEKKLLFKILKTQDTIKALLIRQRFIDYINCFDKVSQSNLSSFNNSNKYIKQVKNTDLFYLGLLCDPFRFSMGTIISSDELYKSTKRNILDDIVGVFFLIWYHICSPSSTPPLVCTSVKTIIPQSEKIMTFNEFNIPDHIIIKAEFAYFFLNRIKVLKYHPIYEFCKLLNKQFNCNLQLNILIDSKQVLKSNNKTSKLLSKVDQTIKMYKN